LNKNFIQIVDIQETQTVDVCVGWAHPRAWATTTDASGNCANYANTFDPSVGDESTNGVLYIVPFTELTSPNNGDVEVNVYARCDNLMLQQPDSAFLPLRRKFTTESEALNGDVSCVTLNKSTANTDNISLHHFGEQVLSFRTLLKRYVTTQVLTFAHDPDTFKSVQVFFE